MVGLYLKDEQMTIVHPFDGLGMVTNRRWIVADLGRWEDGAKFHSGGSVSSGRSEAEPAKVIGF